jgi:hypothetical protein
METAILRWLTDFCKICAPLNKRAFAIISKIYTNKCAIIKNINSRKQKEIKKATRKIRAKEINMILLSLPLSNYSGTRL